MTDVTRFKNYEARCARKPSSIKDTISFSDSTRPASEDGSEVSLDPNLSTFPRPTPTPTSLTPPSR